MNCLRFEYKSDIVYIVESREGLGSRIPRKGIETLAGTRSSIRLKSPRGQFPRKGVETHQSPPFFLENLSSRQALSPQGG